jgi:AraC-like DNA-binding protein
VKELERLAGCPIEFGAETMGIDLSHAILEMPIPTYDPDLRNHLMEYGERLLRERPASTPTLRKRIERILMNSLPGRIVSADEVAGSLGLSRRTFARRLADDGFSYREVVDDLRGDLAKTYLAGGFSIAEIAFLLDYADQAAFSTAFKRWTGKNPSQFRDTAHGHIHH